MRIGLLLFGILIQMSVFAQKEIKVSDPDIDFSYVLPKKWAVVDDGYTYYIVRPSNALECFMSFTYTGEIEEKEEDNLEEAVKFKIDLFYPLNVPGFKLIDTGDEILDGRKAKWLKYHYSSDKVNYTTIEFIYYKHGLLFSVAGNSTPEIFEKSLPTFFEVAKSFKTQEK